MNIIKLFALEHGIRGAQDAGDDVEDDCDAKTGLPIISLYGTKKKPTLENLFWTETNENSDPNSNFNQI